MYFNEFLSLAVVAIILIILGYVTQQLIPSIKDWFKLNLSQKDRDLLNEIFNEIVGAVEYERLKRAAEGAAFDALEYALMLVDLYLQRYGIDLDEKLIEAMLRKWLANHMSWADDDTEFATRAIEKKKTPADHYWA